MKQLAEEDAVVLSPPRSRSVLPVLYAGAITVAALYYGQELMVPLVLACLLAFVLAPARSLLERMRLPRVVAVLVVVLLAFGTIAGLGTIVVRQAASLADSLPRYRTTVMTKWETLTRNVGLIEDFTKRLSPSAGGRTTGEPDASPKSANPAAALGLLDVSGLTIARMVAQPILGPLATGGVVLIFTIFILLSNEDLRDRLVRLVGRQDLHRTILAMNDAASRLSRFFLFQLAINATFGVVIGACLWLLGLPNPLLWAILAAIMRFVPFIGVVIAVIPPLLLAIAVVPGWSLALLTLALFGGAETLMGQVVEPLIYGHSTGLSPLAVIVATAFWALLWGPVGLLIATPLTLCLVVIGRHVEALVFFDVILGDTPPLEPAETFYQRALEQQAATLLPGARRQIAISSLTDYYDNVALPGIALAQGDLSRDALAFERLETIHDQIEKLLVRLAVEKTGGSAAPPRRAMPETWQRDGAIVCIPGRGQLDDLAATMAVQILGADGFGARVEPNLILSSLPSAAARVARTRLCCLSIFEEGSNVAGIRYFIRRIQKQMPDATIVVGLWHVDGTSRLLALLRADGGEEHMVLSIGELLAFCHAVAARDALTSA